MVGIAFLHGFKLEWGCYLALPGDHQTVPTSELFAVLLIVAMVPPVSAVLIVVDSMHVHDGVSGGWYLYPMGEIT